MASSSSESSYSSSEEEDEDDFDRDSTVASYDFSKGVDNSRRHTQVVMNLIAAKKRKESLFQSQRKSLIAAGGGDPKEGECVMMSLNSSPKKQGSDHGTASLEKRRTSVLLTKGRLSYRDVMS